MFASQMKNRETTALTAGANHTRKSRDNHMYETMSRWKKSGWIHLVVYTTSSLSTPLSKQSKAAGQAPEVMAAWEGIVGPLMRAIHECPHQGTISEPRAHPTWYLNVISNDGHFDAKEMSIHQTT